MRRIALITFAFLTIFLFESCFKVPISGRRQVNMLPETSLVGMSLTNYKTFLNENKRVSDGDPRTQLVKTVGNNISNAVERFMKTEGLSKRIKDYKWEFNLVYDDVVNAWCMPGGKVVFYTGILPVTMDEEGLAVVMGHEIAHAVARHGNERMSQQLMVAMGGIGLAVALSEKPEETRNLFMNVYGVGGALGVLKYSRTHESEADKLGAVFMAMAGYNPEKAVDFWERMKKHGSNANTPQFLSTHPSHDKRIQDLKDFMPEAMNHYRASGK